MDGILLGCDAAQEWMLPWWWHHYRAQKLLHPVAIVDFGMSEKARIWCSHYCEVIDLNVSNDFISLKKDVDPKVAAKWEEMYTPHFWSARLGWFKKPLAMLLSPFYRTLWLDLDCEIRGTLAHLFDLCTCETGVAVAKESFIAQEFYQEHTLLLPGEISYNSGVVLFKQKAPLIEKWAERTLSDNHLFIGDQNILSRIIFEERLRIHELDEQYNWNRRLGENPDALIQHWIGGWGKTKIREQIAELSQMPFLSFTPFFQKIDFPEE